jgi:hypothetical protein
LEAETLDLKSKTKRLKETVVEAFLIKEKDMFRPY